jgi:hypothetical protein
LAILSFFLLPLDGVKITEIIGGMTELKTTASELRIRQRLQILRREEFISIVIGWCHGKNLARAHRCCVEDRFAKGSLL